MARVCEICGKGVGSGNKVSKAINKSRRKWAPNLQNVNAVVNGTPRKLRVCTRCIRSGKVQRAV
ncbi:MAG: 50S ribosomal protein L28 [Firmicutes bacterium]|jgi:large subunit ribosomal protein L28|nr:50S ribosomal protein L28 [Bacillota bacterium]